MSTFLKSIQIENISLPSLFATPVRKGDIVEVHNDDIATLLLTRSHWDVESDEDVPVELFHWEKSTAKEYKAQEDAKAEARAGQTPNVRTEPVKADTLEHTNEPEGTHPPKDVADEEEEEEHDAPNSESGDLRMTDLSEDGAGKTEPAPTPAPKTEAKPAKPVKAASKPVTRARTQRTKAK